MLNRRTLFLFAVITLGLWLGGIAGCTATFTSHWPGKHNAIDHTENKTIYKTDAYNIP